MTQAGSDARADGNGETISPSPDAPATGGHSHPDTAELAVVARAQQDPAAFAPLYQRYEPIVRGYCQRRLGDPHAAADATSRIFLRVLAALPAFRPDPARPGSTFRAWLFTIAHNVVIDTHRRDRKHPSLDQPGRDGIPLSESAAVIDPAASPEDIALANDLSRQVHDTLARLPERQRRIVELRLAGLTGAEIAEALGMSLSAVKSAQFRAYATMRTLLDDAHDHDHHHPNPSPPPAEEVSRAS